MHLYLTRELTVGLSNWYPLKSRTGKQIRAALTDEVLAPLPPDCIQSTVIQERIDRVYPTLVNLGRENPQAVRWAILHWHDGVDPTNGWDIEAQKTLVRVLDEVDTSGEILLRLALDHHAHWLDRADAMGYLAARNQRHLVKPLLKLFIKPFQGEIRAAALDALARCGVQDVLPMVQELYSYRAIAKVRTPGSFADLEDTFPQKLLQGFANRYREGVATPHDWLNPWPKLLKARGQLGDSTALRDLIILRDDPYGWSDGVEGLEALIRHMGGLENAVSSLCKESLFVTVEDQLLELACHDPEEAVSQWADYQLAAMAPNKFGERSQTYLNQRAHEWIVTAFQEWLAGIEDIRSQVRDCFFHPDRSVMALTTDYGVGLFRRDRLIPFYSWSPPELTNIHYVDFHPSQPLILVATGMASDWTTEGQMYLVDYARNDARPLLEESWEVRACWFFGDHHIRVIFGGQDEEDSRCFTADLLITNEPQRAKELGVIPINTVAAWEIEQYHKDGTKQSFDEWQQAYSASHPQRMVSALKAWLNDDQPSLNKSLEILFSYTQAWRP